MACAAAERKPFSASSRAADSLASAASNCAIEAEILPRVLSNSGSGTVRWNRAQISLPAGIHQGAGCTQIFLGRHDSIFEERGAGLRDLGSGISDREIVAEINRNLPVARLGDAEASVPGRNPRVT